MITLNNKLAEKLEFHFDAEYYISFLRADWFYVIPTLKFAVNKSSLEFEVNWLLFYFYVAFTKTDD